MGKNRKKRRYFGEEEVDFAFLLSYVDEVKAAGEGCNTDELIDKFLSLTDLKIVVDNADAPIELSEVIADRAPEDDIESEELARIYANQGLYDKSKNIYSRLFLLYSEKIAYFATQIEKLNTLSASKGGESDAEIIGK